MNNQGKSKMKCKNCGYEIDINEATKAIMSSFGKKGGRKSLTKEQAKEMAKKSAEVRSRKAKEKKA